MSKKLHDDDEIATTNYVPPAIHFPDIMSKQTEVSGSIVTSQSCWRAFE